MLIDERKKAFLGYYFSNDRDEYDTFLDFSCIKHFKPIQLI